MIDIYATHSLNTIHELCKRAMILYQITVKITIYSARGRSIILTSQKKEVQDKWEHKQVIGLIRRW